MLFFVNGCSTYIEEANNNHFKPLTPSFEEFNKEELESIKVFDVVVIS